MNRPEYYSNAYRQQLMQKIEHLKGQVFGRSDISSNDSNQEQLRLNRALKVFIAEGHIIKISHNLYAKAMKLELVDRKSQIVLRNSFESVAIEALGKLGIKWEFGEAIQAYNRGETKQIPVVFSVKLKSRFRGKIRAEGRVVYFEGGANAR